MMIGSSLIYVLELGGREVKRVGYCKCTVDETAKQRFVLLKNIFVVICLLVA